MFDSILTFLCSYAITSFDSHIIITIMIIFMAPVVITIFVTVIDIIISSILLLFQCS